MPEKLLQLRKGLKSKRPHFTGQDSHKRKEVTGSWRKPKGLHSKIRHSFRGKTRLVRVGYRSPEQVRDLTRSGLKLNLVFNANDLEKVTKGEGVVISSIVGTKKRIELLKKAKEMSLMVLNFKDPAGYLKNIEEKITAKKTEKGEKEKRRKEEKKERETKAGKLDKKVEQEDLKLKKEEEKKELDKLLTKRE